MRYHALVLFIIALFATPLVYSATKTTNLKLKVSYGDKITVFEIPDAKKLDFVVNGRKRKTLRGNIDSALKKATAVAKEKSNDKSLCLRKHIELNLSVNGAKPTRIVGCIDSKTPAAVKLSELSNLMLFM